MCRTLLRIWGLGVQIPPGAPILGFISPQGRATANRPKKMHWVKALSVLSALSLAVLWIPACTTSTTGPTIGARGATEAQRGFFERLADEFTERECEVFRFTCPYGFGPAGEPCECTEPNGVVRKGRTIK